VPSSELSRNARIAFGVTAGLGWFSLALNLVITAFGVYPSTVTTPSAFGYDNAAGIAGAPGRVIDFLSYFTILSNILVAVMLTALARGRVRPTLLWRTIRMDSLIMITVTGLVFALILAKDADLQGLQYVTNTIEHYIVPVLTVLTWLLWGPRAWLRLVTVFTAMVIPLAWLAYTLIRGAVVDSYPYGFIDVAVLGYGTALVNIAGVLALGIVLGFVFLGLDRLLSRGVSTPPVE
jgi:hypothetical protein